MVFFYKDLEGIHKGSKEQFQELTGAYWTDELLLPDDAEENPYPYSDTERQLAQLLFPLYRAFLKNPPKICVNLGSSSGCHSVCALEKIEKGRVISEYVGEWLPHSHNPSSYRWGPIDARIYRNYSALVEDGFPNVGAVHLYNVEGAPIRIFFVALEEIKEGEMITVHYGMNHSVKLGYHTEYHLERMISFFQKNSLEKIHKRIKELRAKTPKELGWGRALELDNLVTKLHYLYQTPGSLIQLLARGIVRSEEIFQYYEMIDFRYFLLDFPHVPNARQKELISYLEQIKKVFPIPLDYLGADLLNSIRHRIYFSVYLSGVVQGKDQTLAREEALLWNRAYDLVLKNEQTLLASLFEQATNAQKLIESCLQHAKEMRSPLLPWLQALTEPSKS